MADSSFSPIQRYRSCKASHDTLSQQSIEKINELGLEVNPVHFTLIYEYLGDIDPYFSDELNLAIKKQEYSDEKASNLYLKFITHQLQKSIPTDKANALINELLSNLDHWIASTSQKQHSLHTGLQAIQDSTQQDSSVIQEMIPELQALMNETHHLKKQVIQSSEQVRLLKQELERNASMAKTDELTGIPNRRGFNEIIENLSIEAQQKQSSFAVILLDIDHFKNINDTFGHLIGDSVLRYIARLLHKETKGRDSIARFGGEEFVILLPDTQHDSAMQVANNIRKKIESHPLKIKSDQKSMQITISAGVAMYQMGEPTEQLLHRVDQRLYKAKTSGRNRVCGENELY